MTRDTSPRSRTRALVAIGLMAVIAAGCGSASAPSKVVYVESGQVPAGELPSVGASHVVGSSSSTTIPLAKENPLTALFQSLGTFQACLQNLGVTFIGAPDPSDPSSPANDPTYINHLATCAAQSDILQALKDVQNAENNLTPAQIAKENKAYLKWRLCMIGRGWQIPMPTPDSSGRLFSIGGTGNSEPQFTPPPGQSILSSGDMQACADQVEGNSLTGAG